MPSKLACSSNYYWPASGPDFIVGVSAGAINGAFLAHSPDLEMVERMSRLWCAITTKEIVRLSWRSLLGLMGLRNHVSGADGLRGLLRRELPYQTFDQAPVPLHLVCADLVTGDEVVISQGEVIEAVIASTAIPGVFPPVSHQGRLLVDGAVAACTPIAVAARLGATRIIVLPCGFACAQNIISNGAMGRAMHAITLMGARQLRRDFEHYASSISLRIAPPLCPQSQSSFDYSNGAALIAGARESTRRWLESDGLNCGDFPNQLENHRHA